MSVFLVGAGPGSVDLLTLRAAKLLSRAQVVVYDRLVDDEVLALAPADAERIDVGKRPGGSHNQALINDLLISLGQRFDRVVRLKGGDPFVFGRGGEELEVLAKHGISFAVVPGVTAAVACGAYAGIPLTHRDHARGVRFVTAHCRSAMDDVDWSSLARERDTLAIYMGVASVDRIERELLTHGKDPSTPIAFIENGTRPNQRVIIGTLGTAAERAREAAVGSPALLVIGSVAALATDLAWFGQSPDAPALQRAEPVRRRA